MKNHKKYFSIIVAFVLVLAMSTTAFAATVTVPAGDHTYVAYQIFTGTQAPGTEAQPEGVLSNVEWGSGINGAAFLTALKAETGSFAHGTGEGAVGNVFTNCVTAADVAEALGQFSDGSAAAERFAKLAFENKTGNKTTLTAGDQAIDDGYYLIVDETDVAGNNDVANPALLQMTGNIVIASKTNKPTVDKQVYDEPSDMETGHNNTDGWGETADHELFETFQFKLIANLPADIQFNRYATYEVKFTDTWSVGVTYENINSVVVDGVTLNSNQYSLTFPETPERTMVIDISDIKKISGVNLTDGATITVIYEAHLNENAIIANAVTIADETADDNQNKVYLEYSNKPDASGLGKTPEDYVFVFTYETVNKKFDGEPNGDRDNVLESAGFKLYKANGTNKSWAVLNESHKITGWTQYENAEDIPAGAAEGVVAATEVKSDENGMFSFIGLDVGTYYLKESTTPLGFNTCEDIQVNVTATHVENSNEISATVQKTAEAADPTVYKDVVNKKGTELPETGGVGTTIFYIIGGLLMAGALIFLIVRRKMTAYND